MKDQIIIHDSHNKFYRNPFGAVPVKARISLRLKVSLKLHCSRAFVRLWINGCTEQKLQMLEEKDDKEYKTYFLEYDVPEKHGLIWYYFMVESGNEVYYYGNSREHFGGFGEVSKYPPDSYQITVYDQNYKTPAWFKESIMYQIFVDRFFKGESYDRVHINKDCIIHNDWFDEPLYNAEEGEKHYMAKDFFGGNLYGIIQKLPYLKELGVNVLYLNPIFEAFSNHKYDTGDYFKIDPMFGTQDTFMKLCTEAEKYGIEIILDGVFNHTGSDSVYFNKEGNYKQTGAYQSQDSKYFKWYNFRNYPDDYESWWGIETLPQVNENEPSYIDFIVDGEDSVVKHYLLKGAKGWRLDVVDELPDEFVKKIRIAAKSINENNVLIGEVWEDASNKISYGKMREYFLGDELDSVMNYPLRSLIINFLTGLADAESFNEGITSLYENYPAEAFYSLMNVLGTHDTIRILTALSGAPAPQTLSKDQKAVFKLSNEQIHVGVERLKLAVLFIMTFPGVPCIYYGDEAGLYGYTDPFNRKTYPWGRENTDLIEWYKKTASVRMKIDALRTGDFIPLYCSEGVYSFARCIIKGADRFNSIKDSSFNIIVINRDNHKNKINIDLSEWNISGLFDILNGNKKIKIKNGILELYIKPFEGLILSDK